VKVGITGGIGSGKSFICTIIEKLGYPVFYSDKEAAKLMNNNPELILKIQELIGLKAYVDNQINKEEISKFIFKDETNRTKLNRIVHPYVFDSFNKWNSQFSENDIVFNESALLFETGSYSRFDKVILITAPIEKRIDRIKKRDKFSEKEIIKRINSQLADQDKIKLADYVILNDEEELLLPKINNLLQELKNSAL
jgi:dephospho-CoA kinase